jgi:hypothetical protein
MKNNSIIRNSYPTKQQIEEFWKNLWTDRQQYNESADWIEKEIDRVATAPIVDVPNITIEEDPSKFRSITCLPTVYKIFTSVITQKIYQHIETHNIISEEQEGCRKNSRGCKEQVILN